MIKRTTWASLAVVLALCGGSPVLLAQTNQPSQASAPAPDSPEAGMLRRFPQPVRVADLIGLGVFDGDDVRIGTIRDVVRTPQGKIVLLMSVGGFLGWGERLVPVPLEIVAMFGPQLAAFYFSRKELQALPTWSNIDARPIDRNEMIRIALTRR